jgi:hypothetical protein
VFGCKAYSLLLQTSAQCANTIQKDSVAHGHLLAFDRAPEQWDLLAEREIFERQCVPALESRCEGRDNKKLETKHTE